MTAQSLLGEWGTYGLLGALAIALLVAAGTDIHRRQIDNWLNGAIALAAPLFWWACDLDAPAIGMQLLSAALCLVAMWALFALRMMGGGDVKLLVALALWIKPLWFLKLLMLMAILGSASCWLSGTCGAAARIDWPCRMALPSRARGCGWSRTTIWQFFLVEGRSGDRILTIMTENLKMPAEIAEGSR